MVVSGFEVGVKEWWNEEGSVELACAAVLGDCGEGEVNVKGGRWL